MNRSQRRTAARDARWATTSTSPGHHRARAVAAVGSAAALASAGAGAAVVLTGTAAYANPVIEVTNTNDSGPGSLRQAILDANSAAGQDEIQITVTGTVSLGSDLPIVTGDGVSIVGPGSDSFTIDGQDQYRTLQIEGVTSGSVSVSGLTVTGSYVDGVYVALTAVPVTINDVVSTANDGISCHSGFHLYHSPTTVTFVDVVASDNVSECPGAGILVGALLHETVVDISGSRITGNRADNSGAGVAVTGATVTITDSTISDNHGPGTGDDGGGVWAHLGATLLLDRVVVSGNDSVGHGGGVLADNADLTIVDSTISGNHAHATGGGVQTRGDGSLVVTGSTISDNVSTYYAGGLYLDNNGGQTIADSTVSGNRAHVGAGMIADGDGPLAILSSTITANTVDGGGGVDGVVVASRFAAIDVTGSIIAGNGTTDLGGRGVTPVTVPSDHSLLGVVDAATVTVTDLGGARTGVTAAQLALGPLADNGGPTLTHALRAGSVAIDAGGAAAPDFPGNAYDQRGDGYARVVNGLLDVGAYEVQSAGPEPGPEPEPEPTFTG